MFGHDAAGFGDLVAAGEAVGDHFGAFGTFAYRGKEAVFADFEADVAVFVAEGPGHAAAAGVDDLGSGEEAA